MRGSIEHEPDERQQWLDRERELKHVGEINAEIREQLKALA